MTGGAAVVAAFTHHTLQDLLFHDAGGEAASLSRGLKRLSEGDRMVYEAKAAARFARCYLVTLKGD